MRPDSYDFKSALEALHAVPNSHFELNKRDTNTHLYLGQTVATYKGVNPKTKRMIFEFRFNYLIEASQPSVYEDLLAIVEVDDARIAYLMLCQEAHF